MKGSKRVCKNGHTYNKSSDCPVCPICEKQKTPSVEFYNLLAAPARRALENAGIKTPKQLSGYSIAQLLQLHGIGASSVPKLEAVLQQAGIRFKKD